MPETVKCRRHPKYSGNWRPRGRECEGCWKVYDDRHAGEVSYEQRRGVEDLGKRKELNFPRF